MAVVLKLACQGQTHRIPFDDIPDYAAFVLAATESLPKGVAYSAKYVDDEGDLCTLVESTFPDFLTTAEDTPAAQVVLRVQMLPLTSTAPVVHSRARARRLQQAVPKAAWVDDKRDLNKLLEQFVEEPVTAKKKRKKTTKKTLNSAGHDLHPNTEKDGAEESEGNDTDLNGTPGACMNEALGAEQATPPEMLDQQANVDIGYNPAADETHALENIITGQCFVELKDAKCEDDEECQTEAGECGTDDDMSLEVQTNDGLWTAGPPENTLKRASSCPCLSTLAVGQDTVSLAQAWPFVDPNKVSINLSTPIRTPGLAAQASMSPPQENCNVMGIPFTQTFTEARPSMLPHFSCAHQQVVWMPVFIDWQATNYSAPTSYAGVPFALANNAIPAIA